MTTIAEAMASMERFNREWAEREAQENAALDAAGPWARWRCRLGWHKPVTTTSGDVRGALYIRRQCAGRCDAYWLSRDFGPFFRADRR